MKTITQYRDEVKQLLEAVDKVDKQAVTENREPTKEELAAQEAAMNKIDEYRSIIATQERKERMEAELSAPLAPATPAASPAMSPATIAAPLSQPSGMIVGDDLRTQDRFGSFGMQMMAVLQAGMPGGNVDPRLRNAPVNAATGLNEAVPSDGGFLVQSDFSTKLLEEVFETGILPARCEKVTISGNSNSMTMNGIDETSRASSRSGGIIGYWADEAGEKTASKPKFRQIDLKLKKLVGLCYATDENLQDAATLEGIIRNGFRKEFGFQLDEAIINGTGAGMPLGILSAGCLVTVGKEPGQDPDTIMAENIMNMRSRLFAASRPNSVWLINQDCEPQLHRMSLAVGTGGVAVYMPAGGLSGSPYDTLYGRPVIPVEQCSTLGDLGDILYCDFGGYLLAEKGGMQSDMSIHVRFVYDESVFRFILRVDGQPVRASALTPYKGTNTLSHFVALEAR